MKFNQLRILTYLTEAVKAELKINHPAVKDVLSKYWDEIPEDVDFIVNTLDGIEGKLFLHNNSREKIKIHKVLTQMLPTKDNEAIKKIIDEFKREAGHSISVDDPMFSGFEIWEGSIVDLYKMSGKLEPPKPESEESEEDRVLRSAKSCMTKRPSLVKFYDWINGGDPDFIPKHDIRVKGVAYRESGNVTGRVLVWYGVEGTGGKPFMDRAYPDSKALLFHKYAVANGWAYRPGRGPRVDDFRILGGITPNEHGKTNISFTIDIDNYNPRQMVPYMDTFVSGNKKTGILANYYAKSNVDLRKTSGSAFKAIPKVLPNPDIIRFEADWLNRNNRNISIDAVVVEANNTVVWKSGTWNRGKWYGDIWESGLWREGTWMDGTWESGNWKTGHWMKGTFKGTWHHGTWHDGTWKDGTWKDGLWEKGTWESGTWLGGGWVDGIWLGGDWVRGTWKGGTWESGTWGGFASSSSWLNWSGGLIYDPQRLGKNEYVETLEWDGDYVKSTEGISPAVYFGTPKGPYTK